MYDDICFRLCVYNEKSCMLLKPTATEASKKNPPYLDVYSGKYVTDVRSTWRYLTLMTDAQVYLLTLSVLAAS